MRFLGCVRTVAKHQFDLNGNRNSNKNKIESFTTCFFVHTLHILASFWSHFHWYPAFWFNFKIYRRWQFAECVSSCACVYLNQAMREKKRHESANGQTRHSITCVDRERVMHSNMCDGFIFDGTCDSFLADHRENEVETAFRVYFPFEINLRIHHSVRQVTFSEIVLRIENGW